MLLQYLFGLPMMISDGVQQSDCVIVHSPVLKTVASTHLRLEGFVCCDIVVFEGFACAFATFDVIMSCVLNLLVFCRDWL